MRPPFDTQSLEPPTEVVYGNPYPQPPARHPPVQHAAAPRPRRRVFRHGWQDAMYAAIALFFLALTVDASLLGWHLAGGHP